MVKHFIAAFRAAFRKWQIERLDKVIQGCTRSRAQLKQKALAAQAKRDVLQR